MVACLFGSLAESTDRAVAETDPELMRIQERYLQEVRHDHGHARF